VPDIAGPLTYMSENYPDLLTTYYILHDPGTAGQHVNIIAEHSDRLIFGEYYNFDAAGNYTGNVGISDGTTSQQIIGAGYNVHFGNWGGVPVKLAYGLFGLALCFIVATGLRIYFVRRREKGNPAPRLESAWEGVVWGMPAILAATLCLSVITNITDKGLVPIFWIGLILAIIISSYVANAILTRKVLKLSLCVFIIAAVLIHATANTSAIASTALLSVTLPLLAFAAIMFAAVLNVFSKTSDV